jgi:hypothetical protein
MNDRLADVEARLTEIECRLGTLEKKSPLAASHVEATPDSEQASVALREDSVFNAATYLGRVLLIFGGAYLLRAITDFGFLPTQAGIPIGTAYALLWLYMAYRSGANDDRRVAAMLYGGVSVLLGFPILVEAVTRFELLSGPASAVALIVFCGLALLVAVLRNLRSLGWLAMVGGLATAFVLLRASGAAVSFALVLLLLGAVSLGVVYLRRWAGLQWLGAMGANFGVVLLVVLSTNEQWTVDPQAPFILGVALWCAYLLIFVVHSHIERRDPGVFEAAQAVVVSVIAFGAAIMAARVVPADLTIVGVAALVFGVASYGLAFGPETRAARGRSFYFYSTLGLALVVGGSAVLVSPGKAAALWSLMAVGMAWLSGRQDRVSLSLQCTALLIAAGVGSGALGATLHALAGDPVNAWPGLAALQLLMAAAAVLCLFIPVAQRSDRWGVMAGLPQLTVLVLSVWIVGGLMVIILAPVVAGVPDPSADLGRLATLRTTILAASAITLALSSRYKRWPEARWLAYPVLVAVGFKLVFEDFPNGRPVTLFMALALVGGALILVSKLLPRRNALSVETAGIGPDR